MRRVLKCGAANPEISKRPRQIAPAAGRGACHRAVTGRTVRLEWSAIEIVFERRQLTDRPRGQADLLALRRQAFGDLRRFARFVEQVGSEIAAVLGEIVFLAARGNGDAERGKMRSPIAI